MPPLLMHADGSVFGAPVPGHSTMASVKCRSRHTMCIARRSAVACGVRSAALVVSSLQGMVRQPKRDERGATRLQTHQYVAAFTGGVRGTVSLTFSPIVWPPGPGLLGLSAGLQSPHNLVDPASSHMLVSKIKPCMSQYTFLYCKTANGSLKQL